MTYSGETPILSQGTASADAINRWFAARGPAYAPDYAPDKQYQPAPANLGAAIISECTRYPDRIVNSDMVAAQIMIETAGWQSRYARERNNPGGIGAVNDNPDQAIWFASVAAGVRAHVAHLLVYAAGDGDWSRFDPRRDAVAARNWLGVARTWADLNGRWAYPGTTYGQGIAALATMLVAFAADYGGTPVPSGKPRIALAAGHHNTSGGDATEHEQTGHLTPAIAAALRARGFDVRVITPGDGRGDYPGTLSDVARQVTDDDDCFLEVHTEGVGNPNVRGVFAIYPDWGDDVDTDVRDTLGPAIAKSVSAATGLPVRGSGVMSEKQTGVGAGGDRLGVFGATARYKATLTRLIVEYGSHTSPADMALWKAAGFVDRAAAATADALAAFYGLEVLPKEPQGPSQPQRPAEVSDPSARYFPETGYWIQWGFKGFYESYGDGALMAFGYPLSNEMTEDGRPVQYFERAVFEWHADKELVLLRRLGAEALERLAA